MSTIAGQRSNAAWLAAGIGFAAMVWIFYPGFMSPDSAEQWLQARTGNYTSVHPALMAISWSWLERLVPGPGGLFTAHLLLFWGALGWLARELFARPLPQITLVLLIGLWPPLTNVVAHLWKDVPMLGFVLVALAALARDRRLRLDELGKPGAGWLLLATLALTLACAYRHNALPLTVPLLWLVARGLRPRDTPIRALALTGVLTVTVALLAALPNRLPQVSQRPAWPLTAVWDLAAVSIASDRMLIPANWRRDNLTLPELAQAFTPWSNTPIFATNKLHITLFAPTSDEQMSDLRAAWLAAITEHPRDFIHHRLRLTAMLSGLMPGAVPPYLVFAPDFFQIAENPPLERRRPAAQRLWETAGHRLARTPMFAGWFYIALAATLAASAWRRPAHPLLMPILLSAALYLVPLPLIAPSAEFRYLAWPVLAVLIALLLRFAPESHDGRHRTPP